MAQVSRVSKPLYSSHHSATSAQCAHSQSTHYTMQNWPSHSTDEQTHTLLIATV